MLIVLRIKHSSLSARLLKNGVGFQGLLLPWTNKKQYVRAKSLQSCPILCDPLDCSPPGDLPDPGIKPLSLTFPALAGRF